jgi:hypothetical protein
VPRTLRTPDGRTLDIEEAGDPNGRPVLVHGGTPNSRHLYPPHAVDAAVRGLRLISYDRGLDYFAGMGELNVEGIQLFLRDPQAARAQLESDREDMLAASAAELAAVMQTLLSPADAAVLKDALAEFFVYCNQEGLGPSVEGPGLR